jgi:hypothetical protein
MNTNTYCQRYLQWGWRQEATAGNGATVVDLFAQYGITLILDTKNICSQIQEITGQEHERI